jgi:hypothetical protein
MKYLRSGSVFNVLKRLSNMYVCYSEIQLIILTTRVIKVKLTRYTP